MSLHLSCEPRIKWLILGLEPHLLDRFSSRFVCAASNFWWVVKVCAPLEFHYQTQCRATCDSASVCVLISAPFTHVGPRRQTPGPPWLRLNAKSDSGAANWLLQINWALVAETLTTWQWKWLPYQLSFDCLLASCAASPTSTKEMRALR